VYSDIIKCTPRGKVLKENSLIFGAINEPPTALVLLLLLLLILYSKYEPLSFLYHFLYLRYHNYNYNYNYTYNNMVRAPPSRGNTTAGSDDSGSTRNRSSGSIPGPRRGLEWSLRSLHKIDTSAQHFLQNYYEDESDSGDEPEEELEDQSAYDIFKGKDDTKDTKNSVWATLTAPLRTGIVDGKKVVFELHTNVTQKPATDRSERLHQKHVIIKSDQSNWEVRVRFWMMHFSVSRLSVAYLGAFIAMNTIFAGFFYAEAGRCCGDTTLTFSNVFAFTIQTSTTIG
jgi:hypothetical protein